MWKARVGTCVCVGHGRRHECGWMRRTHSRNLRGEALRETCKSMVQTIIFKSRAPLAKWRVISYVFKEVFPMMITSYYKLL